MLREKPMLAEPIVLIKGAAGAGTVAPMGTAGTATGTPAGAAAPGSVSGGVLFNPAPAPAPPSVQAPESGGALLPAPPPMYVRPPASR